MQKKNKSVILWEELYLVKVLHFSIPVSVSVHSVLKFKAGAGAYLTSTGLSSPSQTFVIN